MPTYLPLVRTSPTYMHVFRVSRKHTWNYHISTAALEQRLGLDSIDTYVSRRQLRWLAHVRRMDYTRLPRRMLYPRAAWVGQARGQTAHPAWIVSATCLASGPKCGKCYHKSEKFSRPPGAVNVKKKVWTCSDRVNVERATTDTAAGRSRSHDRHAAPP